MPRSSRWYRDEWGLRGSATVPGPVGFDLDRPSLAASPVPETRPRPILGLGDPSPGDGIAVDGARLLHKLSMREDIEVIVARLPKAVRRISELP